jgi:hypothetical protein
MKRQNGKANILLLSMHQCAHVALPISLSCLSSHYCRQKAQKWTLQRDNLQVQAQKARLQGNLKLAEELDALVGA